MPPTLSPARRLGVLGWPVAHSRSPAIHAAAFAALEMPGWHYQRLPVPPELFEETVRALPELGFVGANVTIPHKEAALALADTASLAAREIGAANTLSFTADGAIAAENTDAPGLIEAIGYAFRGLELPGASAMVLGAGGSARAAVWALTRAGVRDVAVWARRPERAQTLAAALGARAVASPEAADLLVNCTPVGLDGRPGPAAKGPPEGAGLERVASGKGPRTSVEIEQLAREAEALNSLALTLDALREYSNVVDLVYRTGGTPLLKAAHSLGLRTLEGGEILVRQGALSFELWTSRKPPLEVMRGAL